MADKVKGAGIPSLTSEIPSAFDDYMRTGDTIVIAGKGHEDYQIFKDKTIHFDDREIAREFIKARK